MDRKKLISELRQGLDKTLSSHNLSNEESIKNLIRNQLLRSSSYEIQGPIENIVEKRTKEVSNLLDMFKSASLTDSVSRAHETSHADWKLKEDNEEFRVMYREGPQGTPYHTLLVEGYVDAPVDTCLCVSWESTLYKKWWPQFSFPTFKILAVNCLQKVRIGEQICLVRMKLSWPLSSREAIVHYLVLEFFEDDLIIVLLNTVSDLESIDRSTHGFTNDGIPEENDVVRIDVVGGFALQKVSTNRSYFRTIANMDMKLDFAPPSLINFVSRQLIGSGCKLYKKTIASVVNGDEDFNKALEDPLYIQIREGLNPVSKFQKVLEPETLNSEKSICVIPEEHAIETPQTNELVIDQKSLSNNHATETPQADTLVINQKYLSEIEEEDIEQDTHLREDGKGIDHSPTNQIAEQCPVSKEKEGVISLEVENALEILNKAIIMVRGGVFSDQHWSPCGPTNQHSLNWEEVSEAASISSEDGGSPSGDGVCVKAPKVDNMNRSLDEAGDVSGGHNIRHDGPDSPTREVNRNRIAPVSPEQNFPISSKSQQVALSSSHNGTMTEATVLENMMKDYKEVDAKANGIHESSFNGEKEKSGQQKKKWLCCLPRLV